MTATARVAVWRGAADLETPVGAYLKLAEGRAPAFLLESIEGGSARGRYSVIGLDPDLIWRCDGDRVEATGAAATDAPIESLRALIESSRFALDPDLPPMIGGVFGYLGYDMVRHMEHLPSAKPRAIDAPDALLIRPGLFAVFDHVRDELTLAAPAFPGPDHTPDQAMRAAEARVAAARAALDRPLPRAVPAHHTPSPPPASNMEEQTFRDAVERARAYILAGDAFQIVPSQRFSAPFAPPPLAFYRALRRINPAPFLFLFDFGDFAMAGSSPEILVRVRNGMVTIRPLAGTRRRGVTPTEDAALEAELLADPKERAEHLMLIDLGRNDVGRVAVPGSVRVTESFVIERFSHVMHISSTVEGRLRDGSDALDALIAGFPAGTLTGAPKIRAMEIIDELEPDRRGIYAGAVGYFAPDGTMDTCIGLRMGILKDGMLHVQAGAGVVADSVAQAELEETRQKARALFRAAEEAVRFAAGPS